MQVHLIEVFASLKLFGDNDLQEEYTSTSSQKFSVPIDPYRRGTDALTVNLLSALNETTDYNYQVPSLAKMFFRPPVSLSTK